MNSILKTILITSLFVILQQMVFAQVVKDVTITEIGIGKTKDEAKYNALRNAIEKAFGTFISSNTTLLNDELVKDEIVSVSSGNIQKFEILSETQMPDGSYSSVVKATVSIGKLTSFCENKGIEIEFKGELFAAEVKLQELNRLNESLVICNLCTIIKGLGKEIFNYSIETSSPVKNAVRNNQDSWNVPITIEVTLNNNLKNIENIFTQTIRALALTPQEVKSINEKKIATYRIQIASKVYHLRNFNSVDMIDDLFTNIIPFYTLNFEMSNGINNSNALQIIQCIGRGNKSMCGFTLPTSSNPNKNWDEFVSHINYPLYIPLYSSSGTFSGSDLVNSQTEFKNMIYYEIKGLINKTGTQGSNNPHFTEYQKLSINKLNTREGKNEQPFENIILTFDFKDAMKNKFIYCFNNTIPIDELSIIKKYKVEPIKSK